MNTWPTRQPSPNHDAVITALGAIFCQRGAGLIIQDGHVLGEWGYRHRVLEWASASKPVLSTLMLRAVADGVIESPDAFATRSIGEKWTPAPLAMKIV